MAETGSKASFASITQTITAHPAVRQKFTESLAALAAKSTGSSNHVARALLMAALPDIDKGELTVDVALSNTATPSDAVRITGAKRDDLQAAMALIRKDVTDIPLTFDNFRD